MKTYHIIIFFASLLLTASCNKSDFLDKKPNTAITVPVTLNDFQNLLESTSIFNRNASLGQINADEYQVTYADWQGSLSETQRNSYIWEKDLYGGELEIRSWNDLYTEIFYANSVLEGLEKSEFNSTPQGQYLKGWALFARAYAFYDLVKNFCKSYDNIAASTDLGLPIRLSSNIDYTNKRSTLQQSYDRIFNDLTDAEKLLPVERPTGKLNRPSKLAIYALLARIYLDMRNYTLAESYSDKTLNLYNKLIDYNTLNKTASIPFTNTNEEVIYYAVQITDYAWTTTSASGKKVSTELISLYSANDIRLLVFFTKQADGSYSKKASYVNSGLYPFTGLATDELYLIKAECLARRGEINLSMNSLNQLGITRWNKDATNPAKPYQNFSANSTAEALANVLLERRRELAWRGSRWFDLKRLNKGGANITLARLLNGLSYSLPPNDPRYVFPIPFQEINLSGLDQNER